LLFFRAFHCARPEASEAFHAYFIHTAKAEQARTKSARGKKRKLVIERIRFSSVSTEFVYVLLFSSSCRVSEQPHNFQATLRLVCPDWFNAEDPACKPFSTMLSEMMNMKIIEM
jgi:hypothetical protein